MKPAEILEKAADLLESGQVKWSQEGRYLEDCNDVVYGCAMGAIYLAAGCATRDEQEEWRVPYLVTHSVLAAEMKLRHQLPVPGVVETWNDMPDRTMAEVIDMMKLAAKDTRNIEGE